MTEVFMQRVLMVLLLMVLSGSAIAEKIDTDFFETALAGLELIERVEKFTNRKTRRRRRLIPRPNLKNS
jgi:hypothetical protein